MNVLCRGIGPEPKCMSLNQKKTKYPYPTAKVSDSILTGIIFYSYCVLNHEIHHKVFIDAYLQFKSEFRGNYLALTSLYHVYI